MESNKLKLNECKTKVLLCGPAKRRETLHIDGIKIAGANIKFKDTSNVKTL